MVDIKHSRLPAFKKERSCPLFSAAFSTFCVFATYGRRRSPSWRSSSVVSSTPIALRLYSLDKHLVFRMQGGLRLYPSDGPGGKGHGHVCSRGLFYQRMSGRSPPVVPIFMLAQETFCYFIDHTAERGNDMGAVADQQPGAVDAPFLQPVDLPEQDFKINDHPIADHRNDIRADDPWRAADGGRRIHPPRLRMPGVVSAAKRAQHNRLPYR